MPFTEPYKPQDQIEHVRKVGRLAHIILDIRTEYERRPRPDLLAQMLNRIAEMEALRVEMAAHLAQATSDAAAAAVEQPEPAET
jgi:hypothetical protein